jgi:hypothetical protein
MSALLVALSVALAAPAHAQDSEDGADASDAAAKSTEPAQKSGGGLSMEGPYKTSPYAKPVVGAMVWGAAYGVSLGAEAGLSYQQKKSDPVMFGKTRARGSYILGTGISGYDVRVGSFFGPFHKVVGLQVGPDVFYNQLAVNLGDDSVVMFATPGVDLPITGLFDVGVFDAYAGISPGWYIASERENLNALLGQYSYFFGAGLNLAELRLAVGWNRTTTAYGAQDGISVGIGF